MTKTLADMTPEVGAPMDNRAVIAEALRALGQAIRNDWDLIDGREIKSLLDSLALLLEANAPIGIGKLLDNFGIRKDAEYGYLLEWWE